MVFIFQERTYKTYQSIEFFPQKFTQYLLSPEVGFDKCEVVSIPAHPAKGFQRPIQLFTKAGSSPTSTSSTPGTSSTTTAPVVTSTLTTTTGTTTCVNLLRFVDREVRRKDRERRAFERDLFPNELPKFGNCSNLSQRSSESLSQYENLANVYAPSATPCYDTPGYNAEYSQPYEPGKMCYVEVNNLVPNVQENSANVSSGDNFETLANIAPGVHPGTGETPSKPIPASDEGNTVTQTSDELPSNNLGNVAGTARISDGKTETHCENTTIKVSGVNPDKVAEITPNEALSDHSGSSTEKPSNAVPGFIGTTGNLPENATEKKQVLSDNPLEKSANSVPRSGEKNNKSELQESEILPLDNRRNEISNNFSRKRKIDEPLSETFTKACNGESSQSARYTRKVIERAKSPSNISNSQQSSKLTPKDSSMTNHQGAENKESASGLQCHSSALDSTAEKT